MLSQSKHWSAMAVTGSAGPTLLRYADSTRVVVSTDVGCCSWPFYHSMFTFNFDQSKSGGATALPAPMVVTPLLTPENYCPISLMSKLLEVRRVFLFVLFCTSVGRTYNFFL